jgi:hypothetical protein
VTHIGDLPFGKAVEWCRPVTTAVCAINWNAVGDFVFLHRPKRLTEAPLVTPEFIKTNPALIARISNAVALVDLDIHPERLPEEFAGPGANALRARRAGRRHLARLLRNHFELKSDEFPTYVELNQQLSLVASQALCRGLDLTIKVLLWPRVVRCIARASHLEAQRVFGASDYAFVTKTGPLLIRENQIPVWDTSPPGEQVPIEQIYEDTRRNALAQLWSSESRSFRTRTELKFPSDMEITSDPSQDGTTRQRIARLMRRILIQHVDPEVQQCFA